MARIVLPPTTLASNLLATFLFYVASNQRLNMEIIKSERTFVEFPSTADKELAKMVIHTLKDESIRPSKVQGVLPLIPGLGPGTDGSILADLYSDIGVLQVSLKADKRVEIYDNMVKVIERSVTSLPRELASVDVSIGGRDVFEISLGGKELSVPVIVKSEAFYEIGRFSGASDRKRGRPERGRVDYKSSKGVAALLYALLLAFQTGYDGETGRYMFTLLSPGLGKFGFGDNQKVATFHRRIVDDVRRVGLRIWQQDYEGLRLASILRLIEEYVGSYPYLPPLNVVLSHMLFGTTGRRFSLVQSIDITLAELSNYVKPLEVFAAELGAPSIDKIASLLRIMIVSSLRIVSRTNANYARELWQGVKMLTYSFMEGRKREFLDYLYRLARLLSDRSIGLMSELVGAMISTAKDLGEELERLALEQDKEAPLALRKSIRKLISTII